MPKSKTIIDSKKNLIPIRIPNYLKMNQKQKQVKLRFPKVQTTK